MIHGKIDLAEASLIELGLPPFWLDGIGANDDQIRDCGWAGYAGIGYWPVVTTEPSFEPATHRLGALVPGAPDPGTRTVPATYAVDALPPPPPPPEISPRQFFQQLAADGDCTEAEAEAYVETRVLPAALSDVIDTLPERIRFAVRMEVKGAGAFIRSAPTVDLLGYLLGKDAPALDRIWRLASLL